MEIEGQKKKTIKNIVKCLISGIFISVLLLSISKYIVEPQNRDRCHGMLNEGRWVSNEFKEWEPSGCLPVVYQKQDMSACLSNGRVLYIGDSIMREQYFAMVSIIGEPGPTKHNQHDDQHIFIKEQNVTLDLWWDPYINTSKTTDLFHGKINGTKPTLLIVGSGPWYMKGLRDAYYDPWKEAIDRVFDAAIAHSIADKVMVSPIELVQPEKLTAIRRLTITHEKANVMNKYLRERESLLLKPVTPLVVPFVWNDIVSTSVNQTADGLHFELPVTIQQAQLALNYRCNNDPSVKKTSYAFDTTCCYTYPDPAWFQTSILVYILLIVPLGVILYHLPSHCVVDLIRFVFPSTLETLFALFVFGLGLIYMFISDRSQVFGKTVRHVESSAFFCFMVFFGMITVECREEGVFLNRDQMDEWRGWMQLVILLYANASDNPVRVLVSAYVFQTGYEHFLFFYETSDFSASRFFKTVVRLNLLTCVVCYLMDTDYVFYDLSPLVTFWFCVTWVTMRIGACHHSNTGFVVAKMGAMALFTSLVIYTPGVMEGVFDLLKYLFKVRWNVPSRSALDVWIVYVGMICALITVKYGEYKTSPLLQWSSCIVSVIGFVGYIMFELKYKVYPPSMSWIPVLSFVILRNTASLKYYYSRFFAFIGKFSLELSIGQYHMWLAADRHAVLVVLPNPTWVSQTYAGRYFNGVLSTGLFFFVCYYLSQTTRLLAEWMCKPSGVSAAATVPEHVKNDYQENEALIEKDTERLPLWFERYILYNDWIRSFVCLCLLGVMNRFC